MERTPVAQMSDGLPYIEPQTSESNKTGNEMGIQAISPKAADAVTAWVTTTLTSIQVQSFIYTSVVVSVSTVTDISTVIINAASTNSVSGITNPGQATSTEIAGPSITSGALNQTGALSTATNPADTSLSTSITSFFSGNSSATASDFLSGSPSPTGTLPASPESESESAALIHRVSNHKSLIKTMGVLVSAIFLVSAILAAGLYFMRRRAQKNSEVEAAKAAERQEQPLMNEPIVPYSSAYGSNLQH